MESETWFRLNHPERIDTPALLVYKDRVEQNITQMIAIAGDPARLIPHVKTYKMQEVVALQIDRGIRRFKCATIAEGEMLAKAGAAAVLLAYQLNEPKVDRFLELVIKYPRITWSSLVDNITSARLLQERFAAVGSTASVFLDIDNGMHRTGVAPGAALELAGEINTLSNVRIVGLHVYDGHIHDADYTVRKQRCEEGMKPVWDLVAQMDSSGWKFLVVIAGGTPSFTVHALNRAVLCSPGTCLLWDYGYGQKFTEQPFLPAAVLMTRVISKPAPGMVTTDLGHKSVAAENPIDKRIFFLNLEGYTVVSQSEEHLVLQVPPGQEPQIGEVLYGIPYHVCPSVALHDEARVIVGGEQVAVWPVVARQRKISI
jgi:D-serine deaminase-like pyridoxal phosphate-dependent protein